MTILHCPRCRGRSLISTGAFWACNSCNYAITHAALLADQERTHLDSRSTKSVQTKNTRP